MALQLRLEKNQYREDQVTLFRGDQWTLKGRVVDRVQGVNLPVNLTGCSATALFPPGAGVTGNNFPVASVTIEPGTEGYLTVSVPPSQSGPSSVGLTPNGVPLYLAVSGLGGAPLVTVQTPDEPLVIADPGIFE